MELPDFCALNPAARDWCDTVANVRIHGETRRKPSEMFDEEKAMLLPLPPHPYDIGTLVELRASPQFRVKVDTNTYSVPHVVF
jgi:hypothetical protein